MTAEAMPRPEGAGSGAPEASDRTHWERIYRERAIDSLSWFAPHLEESLRLITDVTDRDAAIIDIGGGTSTLVDDLLDLGYRHLDVLDISAAALAIVGQRLAQRATAVRWHTGDVRTVPLPSASYDLWHDRAVFHFLITPADRRAYRDQVLGALRPGGHLVMATFAPDGPERCSGRQVARHDAATIAEALGPEFSLETTRAVTHRTPTGAEQRFTYCRFRRTPPP